MEGGLKMGDIMDTFSFSRLSLYCECPERFYKKYIEGYEEEMTLPLAFGSAVHLGIEYVLNGDTLSNAVVKAMHEIDFYPEVNPNEVMQMISNAPIHGGNGIRGEIETHFKLPLSNEADAPKIQGFIDVLGDGFIFDWKTNRVPYKVTDTYQIGLYAWAINQMKRWEKVYGSLYFTRFRRESRHLYTLDEMEEARKWAYDTAKEIQGKLEILKAMPELKDELFPEIPSRNCSHCPFSVDCFIKNNQIHKYEDKKEIV